MPKTLDQPVKRPEPLEPVPPGTPGSDSVPAPKPHKTCSDGGPAGTDGVENESE
ncbi:MAG TPA: hypothetical protein VFQ51_09160 [Vicinamibacteria bacterium]|nr:hypothetical protein [Vicinamibacteria bacterium]